MAMDNVFKVKSHVETNNGKLTRKAMQDVENGTVIIDLADYEAGNCQNGVIIKKVTVTVPANSTHPICLSFYCGNLSKSSARSNDVYVLGMVSNAQPLLNLCERVKRKLILKTSHAAKILHIRILYNPFDITSVFFLIFYTNFNALAFCSN